MNKQEALDEIKAMSADFSNPGKSRYVGKDMRTAMLDISRRLNDIHTALNQPAVVIVTQKVSDYDRAMGVV